MNKKYPEMTVVRTKKKEEISKEWDKIAEIRREQIYSGIDISMNYVLLPLVESLSNISGEEKLLDVGCGVGTIINHYKSSVRNIVGIDLSRGSISICEELFENYDNIKLYAASIENFTSKNQQKFDIIIANMTLMDAINLESFLFSVSKLLYHGARFVFTITHPCFWPFYWGYIDKPWFHYNKEIIIEAPFRISLSKYSNLKTTHVHRPLSMYYSALREANLAIEKVIEPIPGKSIQAKYPEPWKYPRFIGFRTIKMTLKPKEDYRGNRHGRHSEHINPVQNDF